MVVQVQLHLSIFGSRETGAGWHCLLPLASLFPDGVPCQRRANALGRLGGSEAQTQGAKDSWGSGGYSGGLEDGSWGSRWPATATWRIMAVAAVRRRARRGLPILVAATVGYAAPALGHGDVGAGRRVFWSPQ